MTKRYLDGESYLDSETRMVQCEGRGLCRCLAVALLKGKNKKEKAS